MPASPAKGASTGNSTTSGTTARGGVSSGNAESSYLSKMQVPALVESLLGSVVPSRHPRPYEAVSQLLLPNPPSKSSAPSLNASASSGTAAAAAGRSPRRVDEAMLDSLHFDIFAVDAAGSEGVDLVATIFGRYPDMLKELDIPVDKVRAWAAAVQRNYRPIVPAGLEFAHDNAAGQEGLSVGPDADPTARRRVVDGDDAVPFHNFRHALNVLHTLHVFLTGFKMRDRFDNVTVLAMLVAALSHDLQHPGRDNKFLVATGHPLAVRYCDMAVLEQHHCAVAFAILEDRYTDLCAGFRFENDQPESHTSAALQFTSAQFRRFRQCVVKCILGTEVASHASHTDALKACANAEGGLDTKANEEHASRLMVSLVEAADISNEVRAFPFSRQWAPLVEEEFLRQGDAERCLGMPDTPSSRDREAVKRGVEQAGFITFLCLPLFETLAAIDPSFDECVRNLKSNRDTWNALPS